MPIPFIGFNNRADAAILADGNWSNLGNLQSKNFGLQAISLDANPSSTRFRLDLGANYAVRALALANASLTKNALWRVRMGTSAMDVDFGAGMGDSRITFSGGANGTYFNEAGVLTSGAAPRYDYDRLGYWNGFRSSEDISNSAYWIPNNARVIDTRTVVFGRGSNILQQAGLQLINGMTYVITADVRLISGTDGSFRHYLLNGSGSQFSAEKHVATGKWKTFESSITVSGTTTYGGGYAGLVRGSVPAGDTVATESGTFQIKNLQIQTLPSDREKVPYRKTTTTRIHRCLGLLVEEARTNLLLQSNALDNASWTKTLATVTANQATGLDGALSLDLLKEDTNNGIHFASQPVTFANSTAYCLMCIARRGVGTRDIQLAMSINTGGYAQVSIDLSTGASSGLATGGAAPFTSTLAGAIPMGDGMFWCWLVATAPSSAGAGTANYRLVNAGSNTYTGDNASGVYMGFCDLQAGSTPTSHIPTTTATVTRTVDTATMTSTNFSSWFTSAAAGTLYAEFNKRFDTPAAAVSSFILSAHDGTNANRHVLAVNSTGDAAQMFTYSANVVQSSSSTIAVQSFTFGTVAQKVAMAYQTNDMALVLNGGNPILDGTATMPLPLTTFTIGGGLSGGSPLNGHVRRAAHWAWRMPDVELQDLTTDGPSAVGFDSGWQKTMRFQFTDDEVPANWASQYNVLQAFDGDDAVRYGTVEFMDTTAAVAIGRLFICGGFQPAKQVSYGQKDGRTDLSTSVKALSGKKYGTARRRLRTADFALNWLTQAEADTLHELQALVGTTDEVLYVPDPDDMAMSQRYGGIGTLSELSPIDFPYALTRATALRWEEKI